MKNNLFLSLISTFIFTVFSVVSANAQIKAPPPPPPEFVGTFTLKPDGVQLQQAKHELIVFLLNQDAKNFVTKLRSQNYACQNIDGRHVKCSRFLKDLQSIGSPFENIYDKYKNEKLELFESASRAELINDAEYLTEWKKVQNAKWMNGKFTEIYYTVIKDPTLPQTLIKLKLTNESEQQAYFYLTGGEGGVNIAFQEQESIKLAPAHNFVRDEQLNCLLEVTLVKRN